jgi:hypothetical protein
MKKEFLPQKICVHCHRPFSWRKKWEKKWESVKYCSKKCGSSHRSDNAKKMSDGMKND